MGVGGGILRGVSDLPLLGFGLPVSGTWATPTTMIHLARRAEHLGWASLGRRLLHLSIPWHRRDTRRDTLSSMLLPVHPGATR